MRLYSKKYGEKGDDLIIMHGLFGMSDNWNSLGKRFSQFFKVHLLDLRNHGRSPHSEHFDYKTMSDDLLEYIEEYKISKPLLLGHSLGGKVAMKFTFTYPEKVGRLIVADISPREYDTDFFKNLLPFLSDLDLNKFNKREEVDIAISSAYQDKGMRLFLLKNLYRNNDNQFAWRFNIDVLLKKVSNIREADFIQGNCTIPTCFLKGERSNYINSQDEQLIHKHFKDISIVTVANAGHWLHAENPEGFYVEALNFLTT